ncbi:precorrin-6Y C5,15-methyltransferase (decarboxylating) subunit CbiT, partial [Pseudomonas sp. FW215-R2]
FTVIDHDLTEGLPDELPTPDAVFIGGGATAELVDACLARLPQGGRIVVHGVTMEAETLVVDLSGRLGGELMRFSVENADRIGRLRGWK